MGTLPADLSVDAAQPTIDASGRVDESDETNNRYSGLIGPSSLITMRTVQFDAGENGLLCKHRLAAVENELRPCAFREG